MKEWIKNGFWCRCWEWLLLLRIFSMQEKKKTKILKQTLMHNIYIYKKILNSKIWLLSRVIEKKDSFCIWFLAWIFGWLVESHTKKNSVCMFFLFWLCTIIFDSKLELMLCRQILCYFIQFIFCLWTFFSSIIRYTLCEFQRPRRRYSDSFIV